MRGNSKLKVINTISYIWINLTNTILNKINHIKEYIAYNSNHKKMQKHDKKIFPDFWFKFLLIFFLFKNMPAFSTLICTFAFVFSLFRMFSLKF